MLPLLVFTSRTFKGAYLEAFRENCARESVDMMMGRDIDQMAGSPYSIFRRHYYHLAVTPLNFDLMCFGRHFALIELAKQRNLDRYMISDTDIVFNQQAYRRLEAYIPSDIDVMLSRADQGCAGFEDFSEYTPSFSYWTYAAHRDFVDYLAEFYKRPDSREIVHAVSKRNGDITGNTTISEMTLLHLWANERRPKLFNSVTVRDGMTVDHNISVLDHDVPNAFVGEFGMKKLVLKDDCIYFQRPDGTLVYPLTMHCQGRYKRIMRDIMNHRMMRLRLKAIGIASYNKWTLQKPSLDHLR